MGIIKILDDVAPPEIFALVTKEVQSGIWSFTTRSDDADNNVNFGAADHVNKINDLIKEKRFNEANVIYNLWNTINARVKVEENYKNVLDRVFFNANYPLSEQTVHQDDTATFSKNITIVYFAHDRWDTSWGGEILLYDFAKTRILDGAPPLPNRLVIFPSYLPHRGVQVSRMCPIMRVSIAFQCKFDNTI